MLAEDCQILRVLRELTVRRDSAQAFVAAAVFADF
jgi:hypothetical protein